MTTQTTPATFTLSSCLARLQPPGGGPLPAPAYAPPPDAADRPRLGLAVEGMKWHTSNEGWELFAGLEAGGYRLAGHNLRTPVDDPGPDGPMTLKFEQGLTDCRAALELLNPAVVVLQDKREWEGRTADRVRDPRVAFRNVAALAGRPDVFTLTVLKDAHQQPDYHAESAREIGCHAWVCYYHPRLVARLAPFVRPEHLVRTYHTVDADAVPAYAPHGRRGCLLSGALSSAYPLRQRLWHGAAQIPGCERLPHPGYHARGCCTPAYLATLSTYRVVIATASRFGYALRRLVEATACGCAVVTDLPADERLPLIDGNLHRVSPDASPQEVGRLVGRLLEGYDPARQEAYARAARRWYDYRAAGKRLAGEIEDLRQRYNTAGETP